MVYSLDTLWIMDMKDESAEAVDTAVGIDFGPRGSEDVNMFETIIQYLGGFIAAYDVSDCKDARLLQKASEVGDLAYASFDTPNRMPVTRWNPQKAVSGQQQLSAESGIIAEMIGAMSDSAYEYLPKMYQLLGGTGETAQQYHRM